VSRDLDFYLDSILRDSDSGSNTSGLGLDSYSNYICMNSYSA